MSTNWKTMMGDQWWYQFRGLRAVGDRFPYMEECSDSAIVIQYLYMENENKKITAKRLMQFLIETADEFGKSHIAIKWQRDTAAAEDEVPCRKQLDELSAKGYISYRVCPAKTSSVECIRNSVHESNSVVEISVIQKRIRWFSLGLA